MSKYGVLAGGAKVPAFLAGLGTRNLRIFPVPGLDMLMAKGFDPYKKGLKIEPTPRHANVLLVAAPLSGNLKKAAAIAYAQMPRPRVLVFVEMDEAGPLPKPDLVLRWSEINSLPSILKQLNQHKEKAEAFSPSFLTEALKEKSDDEEGHDHDHMSMDGDDEGEKMQRGDDNSEEKEHKNMDHQNQGEDKHEKEDDSGGHKGMDGEMDMDMDGGGDGGGTDFMSMVMMTKGKPAGEDGLIMDRNEVHFGPFHPGLPDGLSIKMTLDGDTVVDAAVDTAYTGNEQAHYFPENPLKQPDFLGKMSPFQPNTCKFLAMQALFSASGIETRNMDPSALEKERILNHLLSIATLQQAVGDRDLHVAVSRAILDFRNEKLSKEKLDKLVKKIKNRWYLKNRLKPLARIPDNLLHHLSGPVAKAAGKNGDLRAENPVFSNFEPVLLQENNAWGHLLVRLEEIQQSISLMEGFKNQLFDAPPDLNPSDFNGKQSGSSVVETAHGKTSLTIELDQGKLTAVRLSTSSKPLAALVPTLTQGLELGDALVSIASLQLEPYTINPVRS